MIAAAFILWGVGIVLAVPFVLWWAHDFSQIPGRTWFWSGLDRRPWQWAVLIGFVAGGWIAIVTVVRWRYSEPRSVLFEELAERRAERARS